MKVDQYTRSVISRSPLFEPLKAEQLNNVLESAKNYTLREGEYLFHQGDPLHEIYLSTQGSIKLFRLTPNGDEKVVDIIMPGCSFAEAVMFMGGKQYPVHAVALNLSKVIGINVRQYKQILESSNKVCFNLMGVMSQRIHWLLNEVDRLTLHNASFRLISFLLETCADAGLQKQAHSNPVPVDNPQHEDVSTEIHLCAPKHVIASRLSIRPETLSRILRRLSTQGLIKVHDHHIELVNVPALEKIVNKEV